MSQHLSDVSAMNEAWADWFIKRSPRNEEAFYTCFKEAWVASAKHYERRISLLEQEVAWAENGYNKQKEKDHE